MAVVMSELVPILGALGARFGGIAGTWDENRELGDVTSDAGAGHGYMYDDEHISRLLTWLAEAVQHVSHVAE